MFFSSIILCVCVFCVGMDEPHSLQIYISLIRQTDDVTSKAPFTLGHLAVLLSTTAAGKYGDYWGFSHATITKNNAVNAFECLSSSSVVITKRSTAYHDTQDSVVVFTRGYSYTTF